MNNEKEWRLDDPIPNIPKFTESGKLIINEIERQECLECDGFTFGNKDWTMQLSADAERFHINGGFSLTSFEMMANAPDKYANQRMATLVDDKPTLLNSQPRFCRYDSAKERCLGLLDAVADTTPQQWPSVYLVLAESLFWLGDLSMSKDLLSRLAEVVKDDNNLQNLLSYLGEILLLEEVRDEEFHNTAGAENTFIFKTPIPCPLQLMDPTRLRDACTRWTSLQSHEPSAVDEFTRLACIATNDLEGVFKIADHSWPRLIRLGFFESSINGISRHSRIKGKTQILHVLDNTIMSIS